MKQSMKALSPEGNKIIGTLDVVRGTARAAVDLGANGALNIEYLGETEVDWDSQETKTEAGERLLRTVGPRFEEVDAALAAVTELREKAAGTIRLTATENAAG